MKKLIFSMLAMAAMVSCSSEGDPINEVNPPVDGEKVEIKLNTGVGVITTKAAAVTDLKGKEISILRLDGAEAPATWASYSLGQYTADGTTGGVTLGAAQKYYNNDDTKKSYFLGIYTQIPTESSSNVIAFSDHIGETDILCSSVYDAGTKAVQTDPARTNMTFKHMLSKVILKFSATSTGAAAFGNVKKVSILNMPKSLDLTLSSQTIAANSAPNNAELVIYNDPTGAKSLTELTETELVPKFLIPGLGKTNATDLQIVIETEKYNAGETKTPITIAGIVTSDKGEGTLAGYSHTITLTFNDNITINTTVSGIETGGDGSGEVGN